MPSTLLYAGAEPPKVPIRLDVWNDANYTRLRNFLGAHMRSVIPQRMPAASLFLDQTSRELVCDRVEWTELGKKGAVPTVGWVAIGVDEAGGQPGEAGCRYAVVGRLALADPHASFSFVLGLSTDIRTYQVHPRTIMLQQGTEGASERATQTAVTCI